jgi:crotonobetainyl-CoA:carnitine CoA-transferase CaiB-like acyl-CoA transferase
MSLTGEAEGEPKKVGVGICDVMTGMYANSAVHAALFYRQNGGTGQQIDIALVDVQTAWLVNEGTNYLLSGHEPERRGNAHPNIVPYQVFSVSDGHVIVAVGNDPQFQRFCNIVNRPELAKDTRFKTNSLRLEHRQQLIDILTVIMRKQVKQDLIESMEKHGIPSGPINTVAELFASDQVVAREMKITMPYPSANSGTVDLIGNPIKFSKTPIEYRHAPPKCGEHDSEILAEINQHSGFVSATQKPLKSD